MCIRKVKNDFRLYYLFRLEYFEEQELNPVYDHQSINSPQSNADDRLDVPYTSLTQTEIDILHTFHMKLTPESEVILLLSWCTYVCS